MIGILNHSPVTVSILLDREHFKPEFISEDDVQSGLWQEKIANFVRSSRDSRAKVLFVEKLSSLQAMLADGLEADGFKVALYDDGDVLKAVPGVEVVDAGIEDEVWKTYQLLPERLNSALVETAEGVPTETREFDLSSVEEPLPTAVRPARPVPAAESSSATPEMRQADAVMRSILGKVEVAEEDEDEDEALDDVTFPPDEEEERVEVGRALTRTTAAEDEDEAMPDPPPPKPKPKPKTKLKPEPKAAPKPAKKPKKKKLESQKLF